MKWKAVTAWYLLAVSAFPTGAAQPARPVYREIKDWLLACDNVRRCVARQVADPDRPAAPGENRDIDLEIARDAGPNGAITVSLLPVGSLNPAEFRVSDRILPQGWRRTGDDGALTLSGNAAWHFVRALAPAPSLRLGRSSGTGYLSLRGLAAVLLAMDEAQGRMGNVTALIRSGPRAANTTPAAIMPPRIQRPPPPAPLPKPKELARAIRRLQAKVIAHHACDREAASDDRAYPLTRTDAVVVLGCGRFAYQSSVLLFRTPRNRPAAARLLVLPMPAVAGSLVLQADPASRGEYVEGTFDPATQAFTEFSKGRGLADCGNTTEWAFDGNVFRLANLRWQLRCGGVRPGDWPTLYRSRR